MSKTQLDHHIYGEVDNKSDLSKIFTEIRNDVEDANGRADLTELYKRAGYLITLTYAPSWEKKYGDKAEELRKLASSEFTKTAHKINGKARQIGAEANYDDKWGTMK